MKKMFIGILMSFSLLMFPIMSQAQSTSDVVKVIESLPEDSKKQLMEALTPKEKVHQGQPPILDQIANLGKAIGIGIGEAAKSLGVAASDFFNTSAGTFVAVLIGVKVIGPYFAKVLGLLLFLIIGPIMIRFFANRMVTTRIEYDTSIKNMFGNYVKKNFHRDELSSEASFGVFVMIAVMTVAVVLMVVTF